MESYMKLTKIVIFEEKKRVEFSSMASIYVKMQPFDKNVTENVVESLEERKE